MKVLLTIGFVVVLALALAGAQQGAPQQPEIAGFYECQGMNPDGTEYTGSVEITAVRGTFRVRWTMDDGAITGVGIYSNGVLAVSYFGGAPAVVVYKVDGNRLVGEWVMGGFEGQTYSEVLTKTDKRPEQHPAPQRPSAPSAPPRQIRLPAKIA